MKHIKYIAYISLFLLASCSTTKNLPEGEVLYTGIKKIEVTNEDKSKEGEEALTEIEAALAYPPNNALLGSSSIRIPLPFGLWMYNAFVNRKGKVGKWIFNKLASKPVFINTVNPEVRTKVAYNLLREYGYFNGATSYEVEPDPKNPKKAKISYKVEMNNAYTYDSIAYVRLRHRIDTLVQRNIGDRLLRDGDNFNVVQLEAERQRISSLLRNNGYYYFRPEFISYQADTIMNPGKVALRISTKPGLPRTVLRPWKIGDISVFLNGYNNEPPTDSIRYKDMTIFYEGKLRVRPKVLYDRLKFRPGDLYSQQQQEKTQTGFSRLGIFRYSEMQYIPKDTARRCDTLNLQINTVYDLPLDGEEARHHKGDAYHAPAGGPAHRQVALGDVHGRGAHGEHAQQADEHRRRAQKPCVSLIHHVFHPFLSLVGGCEFGAGTVFRLERLRRCAPSRVAPVARAHRLFSYGSGTARDLHPSSRFRPPDLYQQASAWSCSACLACSTNSARTAGYSPKPVSTQAVS